MIRKVILGALLLAVVATTGCGFRRNSYRRPCPDMGAALLPAMSVPVVAGSAPCCCP